MAALKDLYSSEVVATCKTLQSRMFRLGETALNSLWPWRQSLPFNRLQYQMFEGAPQIQFLLTCKLNPADVPTFNVEFFYITAPPRSRKWLI